MQRKATKQSRAANAIEKRHMQWIKERQICAACGNHAPVICHHMYGSAAKVRVDLVPVHIGHAAVIGLCQSCDNLATRGSRRALIMAFDLQSELWRRQYEHSPIRFPDSVELGIRIYERGNA